MTGVKLSPKAKKIKKGLYRHYKNNNYEVLGVVVHSENQEEHVLYKSALWIKINLGETFKDVY